MALDNYSRRQKIMITALIVVIAAMFTVTGSLTYTMGQKSPPTRAGTLDGKVYGAVEFQNIRQALRTAQQLDYGHGQGDEKPRAIYARVPAMTTMPQDASDSPYERSLLDIWPRWQDNDVWCHLVLVKRAEEAGFVRPSNQEVWKSVTQLFNARLTEIERFKQKDLYKEFEERFGQKLQPIEPALRDCLMVRDYVDSLLASERARLSDISTVVSGNHGEVKAQYVRMPIEPFMAEARKQVEREHFNARAARMAGSMGVSGTAAGEDPISEMFQKYQHSEFYSDATVVFDFFRAAYDDPDFRSAVEFDEKLARIFFEALKKAGETKPTEEHKKNIETRIDDEVNWDAKEKNDPTSDKYEKDWKGFTTEQEKALREKYRKELMENRSFREMRAEIFSSIRKEKTPLYAQAAVASFKAELEEEKEKREKLLHAESAVNIQKQQNLDAQRSQRQELRSRFDSIVSVLNSYFNGASARMPEPVPDTAPEDQKKSYDIKLSNLVEDLCRNIENDIGREQLTSLLTTAQHISLDLDRALRDKEARLEEQTNKKEIKDPSDDSIMSAERRELELRKIQTEIAGLKEQIKLRDLLADGTGGKKEDSVREFVEKTRKSLVNYKLALKACLKGDLDLRRFALTELLVQIPVEFGIVLREARDRIVPQNSIDELEAAAQLQRADNDAFEARLRKEAADTRTRNIEALAAKYKIKVERFGTEKDPLTWRQILADPKLSELENVEGAKRFLEEAMYEEGSVSEIMGLADKGVYLLRLVNKKPKFNQGQTEVYERLVQLASMKRARELCIREVKALREDILKRGWDAAIADAKKKWPQLEVKETGWFSSGMDIPGIESEGDSDLLAFSAAPSTAEPDKPFVDRIKEIKPEEGVTELIPEKYNRDILRRPDDEKWSYMLARVSDRRFVDRRMSESDIEDTSYGSGPADIVRERRLAASKVVLDLINPRAVLEGHEVYRYLTPAEEEREGNEPANK